MELLDKKRLDLYLTCEPDLTLRREHDVEYSLMMFSLRLIAGAMTISAAFSTMAGPPVPHTRVRKFVGKAIKHRLALAGLVLATSRSDRVEEYER